MVPQSDQACRSPTNRAQIANPEPKRMWQGLVSSGEKPPLFQIGSWLLVYEFVSLIRVWSPAAISIAILQHSSNSKRKRRGSAEAGKRCRCSGHLKGRVLNPFPGIVEGRTQISKASGRTQCSGSMFADGDGPADACIMVAGMMIPAALAAARDSWRQRTDCLSPQRAGHQAT